MADKKYTLIVTWSDKDPFKDDYAVNNKIAKVRKDAGKEFGIPEAELEGYQVLWKKGGGVDVSLNVEDKLKDVEGLGDGARLELKGPAGELGCA